MSDPTNPLSKFMPGFDFLQGLVRNAGAALPGVGQWIAPTLDPEELEKRIEELRTVQFWLEQNARVLGGTIQALEVQRMTLSTLKTMNVSLGDLTESLKIRMPEPAAAPAPAPAPAPRSPFSFGVPPAAEPAAPAPAPKAKPRARRAAAGSAPEVPTGVVDPMQWWGALTKQFTEIAANTLKDTASDTAKNLAGAMVKQGVDAASDTLKKAAAMPGQMAHSAAATAQQVAEAAGKAAGTAMGLAGAAGQAAGKRRAGSPARKRSPAAKP